MSELKKKLSKLKTDAEKAMNPKNLKTFFIDLPKQVLKGGTPFTPPVKKK